jgi:hypothetical protein
MDPCWWLLQWSSSRLDSSNYAWDFLGLPCIQCTRGGNLGLCEHFSTDWLMSTNSFLIILVAILCSYSGTATTELQHGFSQGH